MGVPDPQRQLATELIDYIWIGLSQLLEGGRRPRTLISQARVSAQLTESHEALGREPQGVHSSWRHREHPLDVVTNHATEHVRKRPKAKERLIRQSAQGLSSTRTLTIACPGLFQRTFRSGGMTRGR